MLPIEKLGELLVAHENFCMAISYNPGYQSVLKDIKHSTRQRFVALEFDYPEPELESRIVATEAGLDNVMLNSLLIPRRAACCCIHRSVATPRWP